MNYNKKDYSLKFVQTIEAFLNQIRRFVNDNQDILRLTKEEPFDVLIEDKGKDSKFKFSISNPKQDKRNEIIFSVVFNPLNSISSSDGKTQVPYPSIHKHLENWINLIKGYNSATWTPNEVLLKEYEKEFFQSFKLVDKNADKPYDLKTQILLHKYLDHVIEVLHKEEDNVHLLREAEEIKKDIPNMTMRTTVRRLSGLWAKARAKSLVLLKELVDVSKKEVFKKLVNEGFDMLGNLIELTKLL